MSFVILLFFALLGLFGVNLIIRGIIGTASYSDPACRACGYDLRTFGERPTSCPECGADLTPRRAIRFAERTRSPVKFIAGVVILVLVPVLAVGLLFAARSAQTRPTGGATIGMPQQLATLPNAQLVAAVPAGVTQPWVWQELDRRVKQGALPAAEVDAAVSHLATYMAAQTAPRRLTWPNEFINNAMNRELLSREALHSLLTAFHGETAEVETRRAIQAGTPSRVSLHFRNRWDLMDEARLIGITAVRVAGEDVSAQPLPVTAIGSDVSVRINGLPVGEHTVELDGEWRIYAPSTSNRTRGPAGPPASWPKDAVVSGSGTVKGTIKVLPFEAMLPEAIDDPSRAADVENAIRVQRVYTYEERGNAMLASDIKFDPVADVPLNMQVVLIVGDAEYDLGSMAIAGTANSWSSSGGLRPLRLTQSLPADVRRAVLELRPRLDQPWAGEPYTRIWGLPIRFDDVEIERTELPADDDG